MTMNNDSIHNLLSIELYSIAEIINTSSILFKNATEQQKNNFIAVSLSSKLISDTIVILKENGTEGIDNLISARENLLSIVEQFADVISNGKFEESYFAYLDASDKLFVATHEYLDKNYFKDKENKEDEILKTLLSDIKE